MDTTPDPTPPATVLIGDEVAGVITEALTSAETFTNAAVKVPFATARLTVDKLRKAADALETKLRSASGK